MCVQLYVYICVCVYVQIYVCEDTIYIERGGKIYAKKEKKKYALMKWKSIINLPN